MKICKIMLAMSQNVVTSRWNGSVISSANRSMSPFNVEYVLREVMAIGMALNLAVFGVEQKTLCARQTCSRCVADFRVCTLLEHLFHVCAICVFMVCLYPMLHVMFRCQWVNLT